MSGRSPKRSDRESTVATASRVESIRAKFQSLKPVMDERLTRLWVGAEAEALGEGGIAIVEEATGMSRTTIRAGRDELRAGVGRLDVVHVRRPGGGRPAIEETQPGIMAALESLVDPVMRGDSESPLRWTSKSTRKLAAELGERGYRVSPQKVGQLLHVSGYSLRATPLEGTAHPARNEQFEFINDRVDSFQERGAPVISVASQETELVDAPRNGRRGRQPQAKPVRVRDFVDAAPGTLIPHGIYNLGRDAAWLNAGIDTPEFAVESIASWWRHMGRRTYPEARELLITADGGGSDSAHSRLWKVALQRFADSSGLLVGVSRFPRGTSKWNRIEHRLSCHVTEDWRGRPPVARETVVQLIGSVRASAVAIRNGELDGLRYRIGLTVPGAEMDGLLITAENFHGEWNYTIHPRHCGHSWPSSL